MKRVFAILIAAAVMLALTAFPAHAERTPRFYMTGPSSVNAGERFTVELRVEGDFQASIMSLRVGFDPASLRYISAEKGEASFGIANDGLTVDGNEYTYGAMLLTGTSSTEGVISKVTFEVLSTASSTIKLSLTVKEFEKFDIITSTQAEPIAHTAEDLTITVSGSSGAGTTPIPGPGSSTPNPGNTANPSNTNNPAQPIATPGPADTDNPLFTRAPLNPDETANPGENQNPDSPAKVTEDPDGNLPADTTEEPGGQNGSGSGLKKFAPWLIGIGSVLVVALIAVVVLVIVRSAKEKKNER